MEQEKNRDKKSSHDDVLKRLIIGLIYLAIVILIFGAGIFVGGTKARFSYRWAENYHKNFGGPRSGFLSDWQKFQVKDFIEDGKDKLIKKFNKETSAE